MSYDNNEKNTIIEGNLAPLQNPSSTTSVKIRKSSNIFSTLVRKARRKKTSSKNPNDVIKNLHVSSQNLSGSSTQSVAAHIEEEVELNCQNYDKKSVQNQDILWENIGVCSETNTSNHSDISLNKTAAFNLENKQACCEKFEANNILKGTFETPQEVLSSFINFHTPLLDITNADALEYLQAVINNFYESENHIINLLAKYITDASSLKEMKSAISNHTKLQWEAERRSSSLANDIWMQQLEIGRTQETILQDTMQSLVRQNRQLQVENESLFRKYEKTCKQLRGDPVDLETDSILKRNEKLQSKLESTFKKIESLEDELSIFQKQNHCLEQELRNSNTKVQNAKALIHKVKTEYEIEHISLNCKVESKEKVLKELLEIGDVVIVDLDNLKRQFKNIPLEMNWPKLKVQGSDIRSIFQICRESINELSKELVNVHAENVIKENEIMTLHEINKNLRDEISVMCKKIENNSNIVSDKQLLEQKYEMLENEVKVAREKTEKLEEENSKFHKIIGDHGSYIKQLKEKERLLEQTKLFAANITAENYSLQKEVVMLNRIIKETGAGDIVKDIEHKHEELETLKNDNLELKQQIETMKHENLALIHNQEIAYKTMQKQVKELEKLSTDNQDLRVKIDSQNQTLMTLQSERMKYLEEKSLLKSIIQHLKNELSKIRQLEDNLSNVSLEASRLVFVAEYSKQQGEKLKQEIVDKDKTIAQLKTSMEKLNEIQVDNAKEKITLCHELSEVSHLKERLSKALSTEVKKFAELGHSKEAMVKSINAQIQQIEERQKNEREATKMLLTNMRLIKEEKEKDLSDKLNLQSEIDQTKTKLIQQDEKCEKLIEEISNKNKEIKELRKEIDTYEKISKESHEKFKNESSKYDLNIRQLKLLIDKLREEKKILENNNSYLKNNTEKLQKALDASKQFEQSTLDVVKHLKQEQEDSKNLANEQNQISKELLKQKEKHTEEKYQLITEKKCLINETECLNNLMEKVVSDFEKSLRSSEEKEKMFKDELDEAKQLIYKHGREIKDLKECIEIKEKRIQELQDVRTTEELQESRYKKLIEEMSQLETELKLSNDAKLNLETQLFDIQDEYNKLNLHTARLEKESEVFESQIKMILKQKEEDYSFYKQHISDISKARQELEVENQKEITKLRLGLEEATITLANERSAYNTLSQVHKDVSGKFVKGIKDLLDAKNMNQDVIKKLKEEQDNFESIRNEKSQLLKEVQGLSKQIEKVNEEKLGLQGQYKEALQKCVLLETQIIQIKADNLQNNENATNQGIQDETFQAVAENLKKELDKDDAIIHRLKMEISELQKQLMLLKLERSDITMKLHETEKKLETEKSLAEQLKNTQKLLLAAVMQLRDEGKVDSADCIHLLHMVRSWTNISVDGARSNRSEF